MNEKSRKEEAYKRGENITLYCILGNVLLSALKFAAGIFGRSQAMIADALHSTSDIIATTVVFISLKIARKPEDESHHYGHGKIEPIASGFIGLTLLTAGFFIVKSLVRNIISHNFITPNSYALAAAGLSILVKEAMFRITLKTGKEIHSESLQADAWHHRSDAYSSIGTLVGIGGSIAGSIFHIPVLAYLDPLAGAIVACLIFHVAFEILQKSFNSLMDSSPEKELLMSAKKIALQTDGVMDCPIIKGRYIGSGLYLDMTLTVPSCLTVAEGHDIASQVKTGIMKNIDQTADVLIHVEPDMGQGKSPYNHRKNKNVFRSGRRRKWRTLKEFNGSLIQSPLPQ